MMARLLKNLDERIIVPLASNCYRKHSELLESLKALATESAVSERRRDIYLRKCKSLQQPNKSMRRW
jgi:hypothetical protein